MGMQRNYQSFPLTLDRNIHEKETLFWRVAKSKLMRRDKLHRYGCWHTNQSSNKANRVWFTETQQHQIYFFCTEFEHIRVTLHGSNGGKQGCLCSIADWVRLVSLKRYSLTYPSNQPLLSLRMILKCWWSVDSRREWRHFANRWYISSIWTVRLSDSVVAGDHKYQVR